MQDFSKHSFFKWNMCEICHQKSCIYNLHMFATQQMVLWGISMYIFEHNQDKSSNFKGCPTSWFKCSYSYLNLYHQSGTARKSIMLTVMWANATEIHLWESNLEDALGIYEQYVEDFTLPHIFQVDSAGVQVIFRSPPGVQVHFFWLRAQPNWHA